MMPLRWDRVSCFFQGLSGSGDPNGPPNRVVEEMFLANWVGVT